MKKRDVNNTEQMIKDNPLIALAEAMAGGTSEMIENQESQGQASFVNSTTLPTDMPDSTREILEKAGVVFGDVVEGDRLFQYVELPEGWEKVKTSHSMHSDLVDDKGRKRAGIFYKAAFYDMRVSLSINRRYGYGVDYVRLDKEKVYIAVVKDCGVAIHETASLPDTDKGWQVSDIVNELAKEWLDEHYPDWQDAGAYWD